jgi:hypothetical protein
MRNIQVSAVFWTLLLAVPFTVLALTMAAYTTENLSEIMYWFSETTRTSSSTGRGMLIEFSARWPELMGMVVGQILILIIVLFSWQSGISEGKSET